MYKKEAKFRQLKQGQTIELNKKIRDQANQIEILKSMINGTKKEVQSKVHNITKLKKRLNSLEKINQIHLTKHSEVNSIASKDYGEPKNGKNVLFSNYDDEDKYSSGEKGIYNHYERDQPIQEAAENLEETGKYKNKTAHFGKTYEKKNMKIKTISDKKGVSEPLASKTPHTRTFKGISPNKVKSIFNYFSRQ